MPFVVGETIGPYRILEQLGRGGMATVFKAYHASLDRYVAIKALHPAFMEDPNFHARFQREARVVAKLEHPNIVPIYDFAEYESRPYLVMKYIDGETLKAKLNDGNIKQAELIQIVDAVGAGLSYAHQQGILHRDVKPSNVLLATDGRIYLADFGLARIAQAGESTLSSDMMLGTPQYISPEQAMGLGELDERTDIYSFGVMLYEMMVGKVPFSADTPFSIIHDHIYTPLPLPRSVNPDVTEPVERVLLKALAKERDDRYLEASVLAEAFNKAILGDASEVPESLSPGPDQTFVADSLEASVDMAVSEIPQTAVEPAVPSDKQRFQTESKVAAGKNRPRFRWWYLLIGMVLMIACCLCAVVGYDTLIGFPGRGEPLSGLLPDEPNNTQSNGDIPSDAQAWIDDDPKDPYAWLYLAELHWGAEEYEEGLGALNRALNLAGDDADFYFNTADDFSDRGYWIEAAHVYLRGIQRFYPEEIPPDLKDEFHEAVYWATDFPEAERDIPIPGIEKVDVPMERVAQARIHLYFGDIYEAENIIEGVLTKINPGMPEALLLLAEINFEKGELEPANNLLADLMGRDDIPDWIRDHVNETMQDVLLIYDLVLADIEANPDDPEMYLNLFDVSLMFGYYDQADEALQQALALAGDDPSIALYAADMASIQQAWLYAAELYAYAGQLSPGENHPELSEKVLEALYHGALDDRAPDVFGELESMMPEDERGILRAAYRDTFIARYKLYYEDIGEAQSIIEDVVRRVPKLALPRLVQAEVYLFTNDISQSEAILIEIQNNRVAPPWVIEEALFMLEEINP